MSIQPGLPSISSRSFHCPHCGVLAHQSWYRALLNPLPTDRNTPSNMTVDPAIAMLRKARGDLLLWSDKLFVPKEKDFNVLIPFWVSVCYHCHRPCLWLDDRILWPRTSRVPGPNSDLPPHIIKVYEEARSILELSPAGAAALLRKALDLLCVHLGAKDDNLSRRIEQTLNMPDFPPKVKQAAHTVRLFGNEQLHADADKLSDAEFFTIHEDDNVTTAEDLFRLLNVVAEHAITVPKEIDAWHSHEKSKDEARWEAKKTAAKNSSGKASGNPKG